jgi:ascorbate-specific PTS system EIIC-type component UlaA
LHIINTSCNTIAVAVAIIFITIIIMIVVQRKEKSFEFDQKESHEKLNNSIDTTQSPYLPLKLQIRQVSSLLIAPSNVQKQPS